MRIVSHVLIITVLFLFTGCEEPGSQLIDSQISTIATTQELKTAESEFEQRLSSDTELDGGEVYGQLGAKAVSLSRLLDAERLYHKALLNYPGSPSTLSNFAGLSNLYRIQFKFTGPADMICCVASDGDSESILSVCCSEGYISAEVTHDTLRNRIVVDSLGGFSRQGGREYIAFCQAYALLFPEDEASAAYLNEAAKLALSLRMPSKAVELYRWIYTGFPKTEAAPKAMFLEAFTLENELKDLESAKTAYEGFLDSYPEDIFAKDAKILLDNLGRDPEEIIRQFQNQQ